jgi:hypothetical protein
MTSLAVALGLILSGTDYFSSNLGRRHFVLLSYKLSIYFWNGLCILFQQCSHVTNPITNSSIYSVFMQY